MHDVSPPLGTDTQSQLPAVENLGWAKAIAVFSIALGLVVLCGWALGIEALKQLLPGLVSMKANTATAFILSGICLYLHTLRQISTSTMLFRRIAATMVALLGLVTLSEYLFGWDAGMDRLLFSEPAGTTLTSHPGRMSNITACNFILIGGALLLMEVRLWLGVQAAASAVATFTFLSLAGYMLGNVSLLHIGGATSIAAHTAVGFLVLAAGILMETQSHGFLLRLRGKSQAIGLTASLLILASIFGAASYNFAQKEKANEWVEHTYEVIVSMESFMDSMHDFLYHNRGFLLTGNERQLVERNVRRSAMLGELARVRQLTSDNPTQQERLTALNKLVALRMERADLAVQVRREKGFEASIAMVASGKGDAMLDEIEAKLNELEAAENDLLKERLRVAEVMRSSSLFTLGVLLGVSLLLLLWVFRTSQLEIIERKRAEKKIKELNRNLESRVTERTAQLEAANKDMESFSYSISHDLRAPLRAINGFSKILQEDYVDRLDDEGQRLLNIVGANAQKMGQLIDDILAFSRTGRNEIERSTINMQNLVAGVWEELKPEMAGRNVQLELRDLPPAEGDAAMMHQVIFNLLSNAVKFTQHNADARIEVGGKTGEHETIYHVKDNGVGFDMQYANKLFGIFLRLHGMDEFEGRRVLAKPAG